MSAGRAELERDVARLASERTALFSRSSHSFGLSAADTVQLHAIERELDECFTAIREIRALGNLTRFAREDRSGRQLIRPATTSTRKPRALS